MKIYQHLFNFFLIFIIGAGALVCAVAGFYLPFAKLDWGLAFLVVFAVTLSSKLSIEIPGSKIHFMMGDTLIYLTLLFYGGPAAILIAAAEAFATSLKFYRAGLYTRFSAVLQNSGIMALATGATVLSLQLFSTLFPPSGNGQTWQEFVTMLGLMSVVQFFSNTAIVAVGVALRQEKSVVAIWQEKCLASSIGYIVGAACAGLFYVIVGQLNVGLVIVVGIVSAILYLTYNHIISEIRLRREQAELAEQNRAEAEAERVLAEQARVKAIEQKAEVESRRAAEAEAHILELSLHIQEQERTRAELALYIAEQQRISEALRQSKEDFRHAALHDALTNLPNRVHIFNKIEQMLARRKSINDVENSIALDSNDFDNSGARARKFSILFMDLDGFKKVNDSLGHSSGDELLKKVADRLRHVMRLEGDLLARLGGDEFAIVLEDLSDVKDAFSFATRVREAISTPFNLGGTQVLTGTSIGIVLSHDEYQKPEEVLRDADLAMYHAKENRSGVAVFNPEMRVRAIKNIEIENDLRQAIDRNELVLYYQPLVSLDDNSLLGFESLIRWQHPRRGLVPPMDFIPIAENTGLIVPVTLWVLRESCLQLSRWHWGRAASQDLYVSVNLSSKHLTHPTLVADVAAILRETGLPAHCLRLELTESAVMENAEQAAEVLQDLRALNIQLSIDDFGTGYSSLSLLHSFPFDTLKIDRSFVSRMTETGENTEIVETIIALARTLKMEVLAEGVETLWQANLLRLLGCRQAQGFLFYRPLPPAEIEAALKSKQSRLATENNFANSNALPIAVNALSVDLSGFDRDESKLIEKGKLLNISDRKTGKPPTSQ